MRAKEFTQEAIKALSPYDFRGGKKYLRTAKWPANDRWIRRSRPLPGYGKDFRYIVDRREISIVAQQKNGNFIEVAVLELASAPTDLPFKTGVYQVGLITTHEAYRGMGLAKKLYELYFKHLGKVLIAGESQSASGRRNWISMFNSDNIEVSGLLGMYDGMFSDARDYTKYLQRLQKYLDDLMAMGAEYVGAGGSGGGKTHWFRVPLRQDKNRLEVFLKTPRIKIYGRLGDLETTLMATWKK